MSALMVVASGPKSQLRNRGIREFFLQPQGTYSVQELSRLWQLTQTEILDVIDSFKMEEIEPRKESRNEWIFSREDALAIASANCLFDGAEVGEALGRDAVPADWKNERLSLEVRLPHWMIQHFRDVCEKRGISPARSVEIMIEELINPDAVRDAALTSLLRDCHPASDNKTAHPTLKFPPLTLANATAFAEEALRELMGRLPPMETAFPGVESQYGNSDEECNRLSEELTPYEERFANILRASGIFESALARATNSPDVLPGELADRVRTAMDSQQLAVAGIQS